MNFPQFIKRLYVLLFARERFCRLNRFLLSLGASGLGIWNWESEKESGEQSVIESIAKAIAQRPETYLVFDVGANVGRYSRLVLNTIPQARVLAFEPHPKSFATLQKLRKKWPDRLETYNIGLGEKTEKTVMFDHADNNGSSHASVFQGVFEKIHQKDSVVTTIQIQNLNNFAEERNIGHIDLLKIDTEGNDYFVLKGAEKLIAQGQIDLIQFEFNELALISRVFFYDFIHLLQNYDLFRLLPHELLRISIQPHLFSELFAFQNVLAIRKGFRTCLV